MTLQIPPGYAEITCWMLNDADPQPWATTWGVDWTLDNFTAAQQARGIAASFFLAFQDFFSEETQFYAATARIGQDGTPLTLYIPTGTANGTSTAAKLPQNCAALFTKVTSQPGRKGKGRMYAPNVLNEAKVNNVGQIDSDFVGDLQLACDAFMSSLTDGEPGSFDPAPMYLLHNSAMAPTLVDNLVCQSTIATQRRRLRK